MQTYYIGLRFDDNSVYTGYHECIGTYHAIFTMLNIVYDSLESGKTIMSKYLAKVEGNSYEQIKTT